MLCRFSAFALFLAPLPAIGGSGPEASLTGLWGCERSFGPQVRGALTISRTEGKWSGSIGGFTEPVRAEKGELFLSLPGERGRFRGRLAAEGKKISGHWIAPRREIDGSVFASPVDLVASGADMWRGRVEPLDDRLSLYLVVRAEADGSLSAFLRNPEQNLGVRLKTAKVSQSGDSVTFAFSGAAVKGRYDEKRRTVSLKFPFSEPEFEFTRRSPGEAAGFYPRTPGADSSVSRRPAAMDDGWPTASLSEAGFDPAAVSALVESILSTKIDSPRAPAIQGLLLARHGKLALEEYFNGFSREEPHDMRSASKTTTSVAVGIAIDKGAKFDVSTPVYSIFSKYGDLAGGEPRKRRITIANLLTMTSGLACDDNDDDSPGNEDVMQNQEKQPDWYRYTLDLPMAREPGEKAVYCSAGINLLGGVISETTGRWLPEWFHDNYAAPLQIATYHMNLMPTGEGYAAGGLRMRPRDFMKMGQLLLSGGSWNGRQVVSRKWIESSLAPRAGLNARGDLGYMWHIDEYRVGDKTYRGYNAGGNGGQLLIVIPELDLVAMITAGNYGDFATWSKFNTELVPRFIIPAAAR
jgi:CubicO group peptidase (beta-lactamase class C family)